VEARFGAFGDSATLQARLVLGLSRMCYRLGNSIGGTRWNYLVTWVMWNLVLIYIETVLSSVQNRCTVCTKRTIGIEIILDTLHRTHR
jgi:hypothetical protein